LQALALEVVRHIKRPAIEVTWEDLSDEQDTPPGTQVTRMDSGILDQDMLDGQGQEQRHITCVKVCKPEGSVLTQLIEALATCGTEFVQVFLEQWEEADAESGSYKAKVSAEDLLRGQEDKSGKQ
jgi:hypothetical protein